MSLYLNVPYCEKEEAKKLGAKWNPKVKKWYINTDRKNYVDFAKWIVDSEDGVVIAIDNIYVIKGQQRCHNCGCSTTVIGLGIGESVSISGVPGCYGFYDDSLSDDIHLAWVSQESDIPPRLLRYLKAHYPVRTRYSKTTGRYCFANQCERCGSLQGNWFLFNEPDSPLSSFTHSEQLKERMRKLKIIGIPLEDDIVVDWDISTCSNDFAYLAYGEYEEVSLADDKENQYYLTYEELYDL